jgi:signal transduction histidine kinase
VHASERAPIVVVGEVLDGAFVDRMRRRYLLDGVRIAPADPEAADRGDSVPVKDFSGETAARLVWTPERPISRLMQDAGPPIAIALAALSAVVAFLLRHERRRNAALMRAAKDAKAASNAKSAFLATMSHEIRTPLNGVLGMARAMAGDELPPAQRQRLEVVCRSGESLLSLLNDLLDLAKVEAGKLELEAAPFDIGEVVESVRAMFVGVAQGKGVALETTVDADAGGAYVGDASKVRQIIVNLASNALKFTDHGSARVAVARMGRGIEIRVSDTGIGIPTDRLASLFQKFEQADASTTRRFGGTGLGLAICREFSELMGGSIRAESEAGKGATFIVELPLPRLEGAQAAPAPAASPEPAPQLGPDALEGPPLRVLAAEDNKINQLVLRTLLNQAGIEPVIVDDGQAAVDAWASDVWDVILMDVQMPVMDGPTATRAIRERERREGRAPTPIIALTANVMAHQVRDYELAGMNGWVAKPIEVGALFASLQAALAPPQDEARSA